MAINKHREHLVVYLEEAKSKIKPEQEAFEKSAFSQKVILNIEEDVWDVVLS